MDGGAHAPPRGRGAVLPDRGHAGLNAPQTGGATRARAAALAVLSAVRSGVPLDLALERRAAGLDDADRRLAQELSAGVLRQQSLLDYELAPLATQGWETVDPGIADVLRLGLYQLRHLDRIPAHAAVSTSVDLARGVAPRAAGFTNAVLRRLIRQRPTTPPDDLATLYSHPAWLVNRWVARFGDAAARELLEWNNRRPSLVLQPARVGMVELGRRLRAAGVEATEAPFGAGWVVEGGSPRDLPGYAAGDFFVQDPAHALVARMVDVSPGTLVYDAAAAPGGKALGLDAAGARVLAGDVSRSRAHRVAENLARAGSGHSWPIVADALHPPLKEARAVLLDAPCLGTGTLARHPDARWRVTPEALETLARRQARLLDALAGLIPAGGWLTYATCSLEPEENACQVKNFLDGHPSFRRDPPSHLPPELLSPDGDLEILPQIHGMDGAWATRLRRVA